MSDENERRFAELLPYYDRVVAFLRQLGLDEDARDIAQEVFIRVYKSRDDYRADAKWNYLQQIARRLAYNHFRDKHAGKRKGIAVPVDDVLGLADHKPGPDSTYDKAETARRVRVVINQLEPNLRGVVIYFYLEEYPVAEICQILGVSEPALKSRLHTARARLRELLGEDLRGLRRDELEDPGKTS
jgi:RNA polymerase sigma-70 factor, ECF subfamily